MKKVVIYTTPACGYCKATKEFFKEKGLDYLEKDISSDEVAKKEFMDKIDGAIPSVPLILVGGDMIHGFDKSKLESLLK